MKTTYFFDRFIISMPSEAVLQCSASGSVDNAVASWAPKIKRPPECTKEALIEELSEYGAWDYDELSDDQANWHRIIWLAAGNIKDDLYGES